MLFILLAAAIGLALAAPLVSMGLLTTFWSELLSGISVLVATFIVTRFINHKPFTAIGLSLHPSTFREFGHGCLAGFLMVTGVFVVEFSLGYVGLEWRGLHLHGISWVILSSTLIFAVGAFFEEVLFRGYFFQTLMQGVTLLPATLIVAALFALAHARNPNVSTFGLINVALAAIWLSFAYMKTRSLWLPCGLHFSWNFSQTTLYSFPTSGIQFAEQRFFLLTQSGPEWLTGGAFGPEGGALATLALVGGTWYVLKSRLSPPGGIITLDSVEDLLEPRTTTVDQVVQHGGNGQGT
jgi:membrane protease YdiL (CAAX protease family)